MNHRRSIRLKRYDYSQAGAYFVTVCVKDHECLFGDVEKAEMNLNNAGNMVKTWWLSIPDKYKHVELDEYMIMPNHFHGIIGIIKNVGQTDVSALMYVYVMIHTSLKIPMKPGKGANT